jgi:hypothetical protein
MLLDCPDFKIPNRVKRLAGSQHRLGDLLFYERKLNVDGLR